MKLLRPRTLRAKIVLGSLAVQFVVLAALVINSVRFVGDTLDEQTRLRLREVSTLLNSAVAPQMANEDHSALESLFGFLLQDQGLQYLVALDRRGRRVAHVGWVEDTLPPVQSALDPWASSPRFDTRIALDLGGEPLGTLHFGISTRFVAEARAELVRRAVAFSAFALLLTTAGMGLLATWLTRPLRRLEAAARVLAEGGEPEPLNLPAHDEVGALAQSFDHMAAQLTERLSDLSASEARMRAIFEQSATGIGFIGLDRRILRVNEPLARLLGWPAGELTGRDYRTLRQVNRDAEAGAHSDATIEALLRGELASVSGDEQLVRRDGTRVWLRSTTTVVRDERGRPRKMLVLVDDVSQRRETEEQVRQLAFYDPLTALANRRLLFDRLAHAMHSAARSGQHGALLMLDLDRFKTLNDTRGHALGDRLLITVAERLNGCARASDSVARLGGDEFVLLLEQLGSDAAVAAAHAERVAEKVRQVLHQPYLLNGSDEEHHHSCSIGLTLFKGAEVAAETLLQQADLALYQAKDAGRNALRFFDPTMQAAVDARAALEARLRRALVQREFELHLQPQLDGAGHVVAAEALLRWCPPDAPMVAPNEFIPVAEDCGLIVPIGDWVLAEACRLLAAWRGHPQLAQLRLAINISARQFRQPRFAEQVHDQLARHGVAADRLELELTESMLHEDIVETIARMQWLRERGVSFSLDDFGTGYSSLSYLKRLPLDQLKIDRSFVRDVTQDSNDAAIVGAIVAMGRSLGLNVVAEGVETAAQHAFLQAQGCDAYQGWLFAPAMPLARFEPWVAARQAATAPALT